MWNPIKSLANTLHTRVLWAKDSEYAGELRDFNIYYLYCDGQWEIYCNHADCRKEWQAPVGYLRFAIFMVKQHFLPSHEEAYPQMPTEEVA